MQADSQNPSLVQYTFTKDYQVNYGQAIYLTGSAPSLGEWVPSKAIRMQCKDNKFWMASLPIPIDTLVQYKFFIAPFETQSTLEDYSWVRWIGNRNQSIHIPVAHRKKFLKQNEEELDIMSFNLRYQNNVDKGQFSWQSRKSKCCQVILDRLPDLLGVQEANANQTAFILSQISQFYNFYARARDLKQGQNCGIFVRKDKFLVREDGYIWINQSKTPGQYGFGSHYLRLYTYIIIEQIGKQNNLIMHVNTHLDNMSALARQEGVKYIAATIEEKISQYAPKLKNVFLTGDFNTSDTDPIFKSLIVQAEKMESLRYKLPESFSDLEQTFNWFKPRQNSQKTLADQMVIIDHIFVRLRGYVGLRFEVLRDKIVSDHYPIMGYFKVAKQ